MFKKSKIFEIFLTFYVNYDIICLYSNLKYGLVPGNDGGCSTDIEVISSRCQGEDSVEVRFGA